jgi:hypothetical protein
MARRRTFHVSGSAGIRPLPMIGSRISANTPCEWCGGQAGAWGGEVRGQGEHRH